MRSNCATFFRPSRAARIAASFMSELRSAPENPGVRSAIIERLMSSASGFSLMWTFNIASRSLRSGRSNVTRRSNRPGRRSAWSSTSGLFVAAMTITFSVCSKPSISTSIWLSVCSRASPCPPIEGERARPTASISSIKIIAGADFFAISKRSRTRDAPTPTNISSNSEPERWKNGTPASPATARASIVFPVPGAPIKSTPFGITAPMSVNFFGLLKKSTISESSSFASFAPATSLNVTFCFPSSG